MKFTESPIWSIIKTAYTHNEQPIIFTLANIIFLIILSIAIYGIIKWRNSNEKSHFTTIIASIISCVFLAFAFFYIINPNNRLGTYEGTVDIAFTSSVDNSNNKIAVFSDKDSDDSDINAFVMNAKYMKELGIKSGKTVQIKAEHKKSPKDETNHIAIDKQDVKSVEEASTIKDYNDQQEKVEKAKQKQQEEKKKDKEKKDKKKDK